MILPNIKEAVLVISVVLLTQTFYFSINIDTDTQVPGCYWTRNR